MKKRDTLCARNIKKWQSSAEETSRRLQDVPSVKFCERHVSAEGSSSKAADTCCRKRAVPLALTFTSVDVTQGRPRAFCLLFCCRARCYGFLREGCSPERRRRTSTTHIRCCIRKGNRAPEVCGSVFVEIRSGSKQSDPVRSNPIRSLRSPFWLDVGALDQLCPTEIAYWAKNYVTILTRAARWMTYFYLKLTHWKRSDRNCSGNNGFAPLAAL